MDTESYPKKSSSGTDPEKTEVPNMPYADNARGIMSPELLKGVYTLVELPPSGVAKILPSNKLSQVLKGITEKGLQSFDPGVFKMYVGALETMQNNIRQAQQTASEEYQKKSQALIEPIMEKAKKAVQKVAKTQGYQYVLDSAAGAGVIVSDGKDLFNDVKKELGF